jgi:peptide/nickel transport system substrate-binding protein
VVGILPATLASAEMITDPTKLTGCGPFKIITSDFSTVVLNRNPNYSLTAPSNLEGVEVKIVKDEQTRMVKLEKGELDLVQNLLSRDKLKALDSRAKNLNVARRPGLNVTYLGFNMKDKIAGNIAVRQAIAHAIDREAIIKHLLGGYAIPASTILPPNDPYLNKDIRAPQLDPKLAEKLLDEAGFKDPDGAGPKERLEIEYKTTTDQTRVSIAKAIAGQLKKVGIKVNVVSMDWGKFKADVEAGRIQMWSLSWIGFKDPDIYRFAFGSANFPPAGPNRGYYKNEKLDKLLDEGVAQTDMSKRQSIYRDVQQIVANELPYVFLWHEEAFAVTAKSVRGFQLFADGRLSSLTQATMAQ